MSTGAIVRVETLIDAAAARFPEKAALIFGERSWTYAQLQAEMDRRAGMLVEVGARAGSVAVAATATTDQLTLTFLACCRAGITVLLLPTHLSPVEAQSLATLAQPGLLLGVGDPWPGLEALPTASLELPGSPGAAARHEARRRSARGSIEDAALIRTTSGTTQARPKLAMIPHRQLTWRRAARAWWETPEGVYCKPQESQFGSFDICQVFALGATLVQTHALAPDLLEAELVAHGVTDLWTVPARLHPLVQSAQPPAAGLRLRSIRTASAALAPALRAAVLARYGVPVVEQYGSTEASFVIGTPLAGAPPGSIGQPFPGVALRLVGEQGEDVPEGESGELAISAPGLMLGYLGDSGATAAVLRDGWLWTGDLARRDAAGNYFLLGRRHLWINVGGRKVSPEEVERVLLEHPGVREAVVLGTPDPARGEVVRAVIIPAADPPELEALLRFCRARLSAHKVPRRIEFRTELPRSPLGKVLRHQL